MRTEIKLNPEQQVRFNRIRAKIQQNRPEYNYGGVYLDTGFYNNQEGTFCVQVYGISAANPGWLWSAKYKSVEEALMAAEKALGLNKQSEDQAKILGEMEKILSSLNHCQIKCLFKVACHLEEMEFRRKLVGLIEHNWANGLD